MSDHAPIVVPSLTGRAGVSQQSKIYQLFATVVDVAGVLQTPDRNILESGWQHDYVPQAHSGDGLAPRNHLCERLWRIGTGCQVAYRSAVNNPVEALAPNQFDALDNGQPPAGVDGGGDGYFRVRVRASGNRGKYTFYMDVDETIELYAFSAQMELVGPPNTDLITQVNQANGTGIAATQQGEVVVDARIGGFIQPIEQPTGLREVTYTQLVPVALDTAVRVAIPKFARSVRIFQAGTGPVSGPWTREVAASASPLNLGQVGFAGRSSLPEDAPLGRESSLLTDTNAATDRLFQVQWTIRP